MKCANCGKEIDEDAIFCNECGKQLKDNTENEKADELTKRATWLVNIIPAIFWFVMPYILIGRLAILNRICGAIALISFSIGLPLLINIRIKYPNHEKSKRLLRWTIAVVSIIILYDILIIVTCYHMIQSINCSGMPG